MTRSIFQIILAIGLSSFGISAGAGDLCSKTHGTPYYALACKSKSAIRVDLHFPNGGSEPGCIRAVKIFTEQKFYSYDVGSDPKSHLVNDIKVLNPQVEHFTDLVVKTVDGSFVLNFNRPGGPNTLTDNQGTSHVLICDFEF